METDSAGLSADAEVRLEADQVEWANIIFVMEPVHRDCLKRDFGPLLCGKRVAVLNIPDNYDFMDDALIKLLLSRCKPHLPR